MHPPPLRFVKEKHASRLVAAVGGGVAAVPRAALPRRIEGHRVRADGLARRARELRAPRGRPSLAERLGCLPWRRRLAPAPRLRLERDDRRRPRRLPRAQDRRDAARGARSVDGAKTMRRSARRLRRRRAGSLDARDPVSYTHLTLPTS